MIQPDVLSYQSSPERWLLIIQNYYQSIGQWLTSNRLSAGTWVFPATLRNKKVRMGMAIVDTNWQNFLLPLPDSEILSWCFPPCEGSGWNKRGRQHRSPHIPVGRPQPCFQMKELYKKAPCHRKRLKAIPNLDTSGKSSVFSKHLSDIQWWYGN